MPKVASIRIRGLDLWFISGDHLPPHFHAERPGEWQVRVRFRLDESEMFETVWTKRAGRPSKRDLRDLAEAVVAHRPQLLQEWQEKVNVGRDPEGEDQ